MILLLKALCLAKEGKAGMMLYCLYPTELITNYGSSAIFIKLPSRKSYGNGRTSNKSLYYERIKKVSIQVMFVKANFGNHAAAHSEVRS